MSSLDKFPPVESIAWGKIREVRVTADGGAYSFEFDLNGKRQKLTIKTTPDSTSCTLSSIDGNPIVHAIQQGKEVKVIDFSSKLKLQAAGSKIRKIGKIRKK